MKNLIVTFFVLTSSISFGQKIVDQTSIILTDSVDWVSGIVIEQPTIPVGELFPDFTTVDLNGNVIDFGSLCSEAIDQEKMIAFSFGSGSCNALRSQLRNFIEPFLRNRGDEVLSFHLLPSVEAHSTNGYPTPYVMPGLVIPQNPIQNEGYEFPQPYVMDELVAVAHNLRSDILAVGDGNWYDPTVILIDSPEGGFSLNFKTPTGFYLVDPVSKQVLFSEIEFECDPAQNFYEQCEEWIESMENVLDQWQDSFTVSISEPSRTVDVKRLNFSILGQESPEYDFFVQDGKKFVVLK